MEIYGLTLDGCEMIEFIYHVVEQMDIFIPSFFSLRSQFECHSAPCCPK